VSESKLTETERGLVPEGDGWFVLNARDAPWVHSDRFGSACFFEGEAPFPELGFNVGVIPPGDGTTMYHYENAQEGFLVIAGEGIVIVEGEERPVRAWDYFHCPAGTPHAMVASGEEPMVVVSVGVRPKEHATVYPVDETAQHHRLGVDEEKTKGAYEGTTFEDGRYREGHLP
jgi:uncharacterized cupin superfamily protein